MADEVARIDEYLAALPAEQRAALEQLRATIRAAAPPEATEGISYGIPAFRHRGALVSYNAASKHLTFHLMSTETFDAHADEFEGFKTGRGSIQFTPDRPIPADLVTKLVRARVAENEARRSR